MNFVLIVFINFFFFFFEYVMDFSMHLNEMILCLVFI